MKIELTQEQVYQNAKLEAILARKKYPVQLQGNCANCGVGIPVGYLAHVTGWTTKTWGQVFRDTVVSHQRSVAIPKVMYCARCAGGVSAPHRDIGRRHLVSAPIGDTPLKDVAAKMVSVMSQKLRSARRIAAKAGYEYSDTIVAILQKLASAGKVELLQEDGKRRWRLP